MKAFPSNSAGHTLILLPSYSDYRATRFVGNVGGVLKFRDSPTGIRLSKVYVRAPGAAEYVGLAVSTMAKLRVSGYGPKYSKLGRAVIYSYAELDAWLSSLKRSSTSATAPNAKTGAQD